MSTARNRFFKSRSESLEVGWMRPLLLDSLIREVGEKCVRALSAGLTMPDG